MENHQIQALIRQELPRVLEDNLELRSWVTSLVQEQYKIYMGDRIDHILEELQRDREINTRKWEEASARLDRMMEEQARKWEENTARLDRIMEEQARKWEETSARLDRMMEEQARKWEEQNRKWEESTARLDRMMEEQARKWEEQNRKWEEQNRKWDKNQETINEMLAEIRELAHRHDSTLGALGARWGLHTEQSFRNALAGILEESFGVQVLNVTEYDETGEVFGRPDQVELDIIIQDGTLILCEIKSSMSKSDMYTFDRKVAFYEKRHDRKANRKLVISPMVAPEAQTVARELGIEVYSYANSVEL
ncbi:MAG: PD-(D/E)XK nuclease family protein [Anaerolineae bacterium]